MNVSMRRCLLTIATGLLAVCASAAPPAVSVCAECHGADGMGLGTPMIPVIAGMPAPHIEEAIYAYVDGARQCVREPRMCETAAALSDADIEAVADHYAGQAREFSGADYDPDLVAEGARIHEASCSICHWRPDAPDVEDALGIPLHGQRPDYLRLALDEYRSGARLELLDAMADRIDALRPGDFEALVHYYSSYGAADETGPAE